MARDVLVTDLLAERDRDVAASILWRAFAGKLGTVLGRDGRGAVFLAETLDADMCLVAHGAEDGELLGILVMTRAGHAGPGGEVASLWRVYGPSAAWRLPLLLWMDGDPSPDALYVDSISIAPEARGRGVGTALMARATAVARESGLAAVELEVIDANPRAMALYASLGYVKTKHESVPWPLSSWLSIRGTTSMRLELR